jgi:hypothetical protein
MVAAPAGPSTSRTSNRCPVARPTLAVGRRVRHRAMTAGSVLASRTLRHQLAARMLGPHARFPQEQPQPTRPLAGTVGRWEPERAAAGPGSRGRRPAPQPAVPAAGRPSEPTARMPGGQALALDVVFEVADPPWSRSVATGSRTRASPGGQLQPSLTSGGAIRRRYWRVRLGIGRLAICSLRLGRRSAMLRRAAGDATVTSSSHTAWCPVQQHDQRPEQHSEKLAKLGPPTDAKLIVDRSRSPLPWACLSTTLRRLRWVGSGVARP